MVTDISVTDVTHIELSILTQLYVEYPYFWYW